METKSQRESECVFVVPPKKPGRSSPPEVPGSLACVSAGMEVLGLPRAWHILLGAVNPMDRSPNICLHLSGWKGVCGSTWGHSLSLFVDRPSARNGHYQSDPQPPCVGSPQRAGLISVPASSRFLRGPGDGDWYLNRSLYHSYSYSIPIITESRD